MPFVDVFELKVEGVRDALHGSKDDEWREEEEEGNADICVSSNEDI